MNVKCWILHAGPISCLRKGLGLADAFELVPQVFAPDDASLALLLDRSISADEFPDLLISIGQGTIETACLIRALSLGKTFSVFVQTPRRPGTFDLVIRPRHDDFPIQSEVCITEGALHNVTPAVLERSKHEFPELWHCVSPRVAVLIGATNATYQLGLNEACNIASQLRTLKQRYNASLMVTTSNRTEPAVEAVFKETLRDCCAHFWDGNDRNPYLGYLASAEFVIVTPDSLSMVSEAAATGKPVYYYKLPEIGTRHKPFFENMTRLGVVRPFVGRLESWAYEPLRDIEQASAAIRDLLFRRVKK